MSHGGDVQRRLLAIISEAQVIAGSMSHARVEEVGFRIGNDFEYAVGETDGGDRV